MTNSTKIDLIQVESSFRDPSGYVFNDNDRNIYRTITKFGKEHFDFVEETGVLDDLIKSNKVISYKKKDPEKFKGVDHSVSYLISHPRVPFISYPYEWSFGQLKDAALLHLDIQIESLEKGVMLSDATAYNIQFIGYKPIFIDLLSFIKYEDGMLWKGQGQFVEQFLNPLLLYAYTGVPFNDWYRGRLKGISSQELNRLIPLWKKISIRYFNYILLPCYFENKEKKQSKPRIKPKNANLPKSGLVFILKQLKKWISILSPPNVKTVWNAYSDFRNYKTKEVKKKTDFVKEKISKIKPTIVWDIGSNTGEFCFAALEAGAKYVVGLENDSGANTIAYENSKKKQKNFIPIYIDISIPSTNSGWNEKERSGLLERKNADFLLALAVIHHIVIGNNVPFQKALEYFINLAPIGIIEWVPKSDPMIQRMLIFRDDIFDDYEYDKFISYIKKLANIVDKKVISESGRTLIFYKRD